MAYTLADQPLAETGGQNAGPSRAGGSSASAMNSHDPSSAQIGAQHFHDSRLSNTADSGAQAWVEKGNAGHNGAGSSSRGPSRAAEYARAYKGSSNGQLSATPSAASLSQTAQAPHTSQSPHLHPQQAPSRSHSKDKDTYPLEVLNEKESGAYAR